VLHLINFQLRGVDAVQRCFGRLEPGACALLIENGVYSARNGGAESAELINLLAEFEIRVLGPDLEARGIAASKLINGIHVIDYADFVELSITEGPVISWFDS